MKLASILCPTDFSEPSRHATAYAAVIANWSGARVIPLHVETPAFAAVTAVVGGQQPATPPGGTQVVYADSAAEAIAEFAVTARVDLIVIGTHGASGFRQLILGSVTETLLRQVSCPVLVVPPRAHSNTGAPFARVLAALDFTASSLAALRVACSFAEDAGADLNVLHVIDEPDEHALFVARPYDVHHHPERYERRVAEHLERTLPRNTCEFSRLKYRIAHGVAEHEILRVAADTRANVIAVGVGGTTKAPAFGSTVNHIVRHAVCPVLTVRG